MRDFFRASQWTNTLRIFSRHFCKLAAASAFLSGTCWLPRSGANYGIYGPAFELLESRPVRPGSEEYSNSEKYQIRQWDLERPDSLRELIALVNKIRQQNRALQTDWTLQFHPVDNDQLICYSKTAADGSNLLLMVVNLDPHHTQSGFVNLPLDKLGIEEDRPYQANDLLTGASCLERQAKYTSSSARCSAGAHLPNAPAASSGA